MWNEEHDTWGCDICCEPIFEGEPLVRLAADAAFSDGEGGCETNKPRQVTLFAIFHSECIIDTMHDDDYLNIDYVHEAREALFSAPLCECCEDRMVSPKQRRAGFKLLKGGV